MATPPTSISDKVRQGFTILELLIAIAIISIIAIVAWTLYQNYMIKSRVSELIATAAPVQLAVAEFVQTQCPSGSSLATCISSTNLNNTYAPPPHQGNIKTFSINPGGMIAVTGNDEAENIVITFTPRLETDGSVTWVCHSSPEASKKYAPSTCQ